MFVNITSAVKTDVEDGAVMFGLQVKMLSTGDVQGCLRKLETLLRAIKYPGHVDYNG